MKLFFNYSIDCELPVNTPYTGPERRHHKQVEIRIFICAVMGLFAGMSSVMRKESWHLTFGMR